MQDLISHAFHAFTWLKRIWLLSFFITYIHLFVLYTSFCQRTSTPHEEQQKFKTLCEGVQNCLALFQTSLSEVSICDCNKKPVCTLFV